MFAPSDCGSQDFCYPPLVHPHDTGGTGDAVLLEALRAGEADAYAALVERYGGRMRCTALRLLGSEDQADDAVQEAFLSAFRSLATFAGESSLGTWLHRIVINAALMKRRSESRRSARKVDVDDLLPRFTSMGAFTQAQVPWSEPADEPAIQRETRERVTQCIARLPDAYRLPLVLRDLEGLSNRELADQLEVTVNAAKVRVHRARQALRQLLEPTFGATP